MMDQLLSTSSSDGSLAAIRAPSVVSSLRHSIQVYQVSESSTTLQSTLIHTSRLPLVQLVFVGTASVLGLFGRREIVVWDLHRGVVATTLSVSDDQAFVSLAVSSGDDEHEHETYFVLVRHGPKQLVVHEYKSSNNKLVRKIKSGRSHGFDDLDEVDNEAVGELHGRNDAAMSLIITSSHIAVCTKNNEIRIMDKQTGKKTGKISMKSSTTAAHVGETSRTQLITSLGNPHILVASKHDGDLIFYNLDSCKEVARLPSDGSESTEQGRVQSSLQVLARTKEDEFTVLRNGVLHSIVAAVSGENRSPQYEKISQLSSDNPVSLFLRKNNKLLALTYQRLTEYRIQWIDLSSTKYGVGIPALYKLDQPHVSTKDKNDGKTTTKRKPSDSKVLGPGQAGSEPIGSRKKIKLSTENMNDDEENNCNNNDTNATIAERLKMLTDALNKETDDIDDDDDDGDVKPKDDITTIVGVASDTKFKPHKANTESLKELLTQALQSSDDSLLELALSVHDVKIIATTIKEMNEDLLVILLGKLTSRLATSPLRAEALSVWISHCLKQGSFDSEHLAVLRNMLYERIESFSDLLRLEGRLSMMVD